MLSIAHVDLYFFYDIDVVLLNVEVHGDDLTLPQAQELLYRFGRAYPAGWDENGDGLHCLHTLQWLAADGTVLAQSDSGDRDKFLSFVVEASRTAHQLALGVPDAAAGTRPRRGSGLRFATGKSSTTGCR